MAPQRETSVTSALRIFTVYGFVPAARLTREERREIYGAPEGAWVRLAKLAASSEGAAVAKARRQAWCRDERVAKYRAEIEDETQPGLF
jgi:hypothetical protein